MPSRTSPIDSFVHKGPPNKLMTNLKSPMRVVTKDGTNCQVLDLTMNKVQSVHVARLKPFNYDPERTNPAEAVHSDKQEFTLETI